MKKLLAIILAVIMVLTVVACGGNNTQNSSGNNSSIDNENPISSPIGDLSSSFGGSSSSQAEGSSSCGDENSSSGGGQEDPPQPELAPFERITAMEGNIFSLTFDSETAFTPLYDDSGKAGLWNNEVPKGLYQNFSIKNNEGAPKTNYVSVNNGVAELIDKSNGGTKMIIDFADKDIDNGAIEGYFEFKMIEVGPGWTPIQFYGIDAQKNGEIFGVRTKTTALSNGDVEAGIRIDGNSDNLVNPTMVFKNGNTYSFNFIFNIDYGRFSIRINALKENYYVEYDMDIKSVQGIIFSTSDGGTRRGSLDNFAVSTFSDTAIFTNQLKAYADSNMAYVSGNEQVTANVKSLLDEFNGLLLTQTEKTKKQLFEEYKQKLYDLFAASSQTFVVDSTMGEFIDYFLNTTSSYRPSWASEGFKNRWNYIDGVFLEGLVQNYERTKNERYKNFFINFINYYIHEEGKNLDAKFRKPDSGMTNSAYYGNELDSVCESRILFDAYNYTGDKRYLEAIDFTYNKLKSGVIPMAGNSGCYSHKSGYKDQVWLDGFYMYAPFTIRYANLKGNKALITELTNQYRFVYNNMRAANGLYKHGIDVTKTLDWADKQTGLSQSVWLRAEGWLLASMVDCLEYYPEGAEKEFLKKMFSEAMASIVTFRDATTGMYYNVVDFDPTVDMGSGVYNKLETSGSALVAYACMKGARLGVLSQDYSTIGVQTFKGIFNNKIEKVGKTYVLKDIILSAGLGGHRNGTPAYYMSEMNKKTASGQEAGRNDGKGVGPFMMAYNEFALWSAKQTH